VYKIYCAFKKLRMIGKTHIRFDSVLVKRLVIYCLGQHE